jgi:hypothetical protein
MEFGVELKATAEFTRPLSDDEIEVLIEVIVDELDQLDDVRDPFVTTEDEDSDGALEITILMVVEATPTDEIEPLLKALPLVRSALHAARIATPGMEARNLRPRITRQYEPA